MPPGTAVTAAEVGAWLRRRLGYHPATSCEEVKLDGALTGQVAWGKASASDFSALLTASDQGVDKFSVAVAADGEASDDDAYEGGLTGAV